MKNCKLCGVSDEAFGCYETCTANGPQHEWSTFEDLRRELKDMRSQTSTITDIPRVDNLGLEPRQFSEDDLIKLAVARYCRLNIDEISRIEIGVQMKGKAETVTLNLGLSPATAKECAKCSGPYHDPTWACPSPTPVITKCEHGRWQDRCLSCAVADVSLDTHNGEKK